MVLVLRFEAHEHRRVVFEDVIKAHYDQTNKMFGTNYQPPGQ